MKKYQITFTDGTIKQMICAEEGVEPNQEVEKWQNPIYSVENIINIQEVEEFPTDPQ